MKIKKILIVFICLILIIALSGCAQKTPENKEKIVTSFYPMYIIALNLTKDVTNVELDNMTDTSVGCLHNYTLQTSDLKKIENANIFIKNGLGLEIFMDKITKTYPNIDIVDASEANLDLVQDEEGDNGHVWNSIENYKKQVSWIANNLMQKNPENSELYKKNEEQYLTKIDELEVYKAEKEEYVISCNEALAYLLKDANLTVIPVYTDHDESSLSSGKLSEVIDKAKDKNIKAIFVDEKDDTKNAEIIARETGAQIVKLNSNLYGENNADAYLNTMQSNFDILRKTFEK